MTTLRGAISTAPGALDELVRAGLNRAAIDLTELTHRSFHVRQEDLQLHSVHYGSFLRADASDNILVTQHCRGSLTGRVRIRYGVDQAERLLDLLLLRQIKTEALISADLGALLELGEIFTGQIVESLGRYRGAPVTVFPAEISRSSVPCSDHGPVASEECKTEIIGGDIPVIVGKSFAEFSLLVELAIPREVLR